MATRKITTQTTKETAILTISNADFASKLKKQVEIGRNYLAETFQITMN